MLFYYFVVMLIDLNNSHIRH